MLKSLKLKWGRLAIALAAVGAGVGFYQLQTWFVGAPSTTVFHECVERGKKEGMDAAITKNFCINKYQGLVADGAIGGKAGPIHCELNDKIALEKGLAELDKKGSWTSTELDAALLRKDEPRTCDEYEFDIKNPSKEYVVTLIEFSIKNLKTGSSENHVFEGQWIEPSKATSLKVKLNNPFYQANFDEKSQHEWMMTTIKGFKMNY